MSYYDDRKIMMKRIKEWCYKTETDREPWKQIVAEAGELFGFSERSLHNILNQISQGSLKITKSGELEKIGNDE